MQSSSVRAHTNGYVCQIGLAPTAHEPDDKRVRSAIVVPAEKIVTTLQLKAKR